MANIGDMVRQNIQTAQSTIQRVRTRVRSRAEGLLPMPSSNPGGIIGRLRSGSPILSTGGGGVMERVKQARERITGGAAGQSVLGGSKVREVGSGPGVRVGKVKVL